MNRKKKFAVSAFAMMLLWVSVTSGVIYNPVMAAEQKVEIIDISLGIVPLADTPGAFTIPVPAASGTATKKNEKSEIDYSNTAGGYVMVKYLQKTTKELRVIIKGPSGVSYTYTLKSGGEYEVYPLSDGSGSYTVGVWEQTEGTKYATVNSVTADVKLTDEFAPFLSPNQYVNYNKDSKTVKKAAELIKDSKTLADKIAAIYKYVIKNITYDKQLAATVKSGYLPDVDAVLEKGKGICFDYAAVMTAMLRSQGIPAKLVVGYAGDVYHAWISVYSSETGQINTYIVFDGKSWKLMDPTYASGANESSDIMKYISNSKNYTAKYLY